MARASFLAATTAETLCGGLSLGGVEGSRRSAPMTRHVRTRTTAQPTLSNVAVTSATVATRSITAARLLGLSAS
jgi:hypothetical protein